MRSQGISSLSANNRNHYAPPAARGPQDTLPTGWHLIMATNIDVSVAIQDPKLPGLTERTEAVVIMADQLDEHSFTRALSIVFPPLESASQSAFNTRRGPHPCLHPSRPSHPSCHCL
jgi:hypothetical protein